jgi:surfactin family lipopeptide synthetase A
MSQIGFPASFSQERLWFLDQFEPESPAYNLPRVFRIIGDLRVDVLTRAFHAVVRRHEALRTVFRSIEGEPRQVVVSDVDFHIPIIDLTDAPEAEQESEALHLASVEGKKPFDLSKGPLLRVILIRLGPQAWMMVLVMHHIATDGWSISRLFRDVTESYAAFLENREPRLPELPIRYTDYAQWQREYMTGPVLQSEIEHWKKVLAGAQTLLELATDHPRQGNQTWNGASKEIVFDRATLAKMKSLAQKEGATLFMVVMAAFQTLLWRYTHQQNILVGTPVALRDRVEVENMVGLFVNTLIFRTDFSADLTFRDLIQRVRSFALEAYAHQDVPFEKLVEELVPERSLNTPPLFQVMFIFQNIPKQVFEISGLSIKEINFETGIAKFDLSVEVWEEKDFHCQFEYNTDLFEQVTMHRMLEHFERIIRAAIENPDQRLSRIPMMGTLELQQVLVDWNQTATDYSRTHQRPGVHELFELQVERCPDAVAVISGNQQITYSELDRRANQLAHYLLKRGVRVDVAVGLSVERGIGMVIALLGILKAGGAYVPLDTRLPDDRLSFMLADAKPRVVITDQQSGRNIFGENTVRLDSDWKLISAESQERPEQKVDAHALAYVMYTSGSTGKPKGVPVEHGSVVNLLLSMQQEPGLDRDDVLLTVTPLSFDISGLEIYLPLISGARLVVAASDDVIDGSRLKILLSNHRATCMQATPATWRLLLETGWQGSPDLKILCGGEALPPDLAKDLSARAVSVWNVYGPTETTIWSTAYRLTGGENGTIPIGRPIANTAVYILDSERNPVPINVTGEIYIGGDGLARGYLNRPELTGERFVANPLIANGDRLYRTGDLGRFRSNSNIEYLGRADSQVKLRGFRIELAEIESVLAAHPMIREAVVLPTGQGEHQKLSAYVVVANGEVPDAGELRRYLRTKLAEHMLPVAYWRVERLPLLPSGKVDRAALPVIPAVGLKEEAELVDPRNDTEVKLASIWRELLKMETLGIEQNFFELGGHSLLAMQVIARIRRIFGVELPVRSLFEAPTIAALAVELEKLRTAGLTARASILDSHHPAPAIEAKKDAVLLELQKLSPGAMREIIENALGRKQRV